MKSLTLRNVITASAFAASVFVGPAESKAIFHWCRGCGAAPAAPPAPLYAPAPPAVSYYAPCAPPTVVNYVPQTYYRPVVVNTPVTTYRPVTSCGLCGPSTVMRPVTTMVQQTQYVPYTSYRLMYGPAYAPAYTANYLAPAPVAAPAAACCAPAAPAAMAPAPLGATPMPTLNGPVPATGNYPPPGMPSFESSTGTIYSNGQSSGTPATSNYPAPAGSPTPADPRSGGTAPLFDQKQTSPPDIRLNPVPEPPSPQADPASTLPRQPDAVDARTAARRAVTGVIPAYYTQPTAPMPNAAWRPSSR